MIGLQEISTNVSIPSSKLRNGLAYMTKKWKDGYEYSVGGIVCGEVIDWEKPNLTKEKHTE